MYPVIRLKRTVPSSNTLNDYVISVNNNNNSGMSSSGGLVSNIVMKNDNEEDNFGKTGSLSLLFAPAM
jgi:hypothetical protein